MQSHDHAVFLVFTSRGRPCFVGKTRGDPAAVFGPTGRAPIVAIVREGMTEVEAAETVMALTAAIGTERLGVASVQELEYISA